MLSLFPFLFGDYFLHFPDDSTNPPFFDNVDSSVNIPFSYLLFPPSCEIAVVSYGFLFLRDVRWVHVGVEATKHAVSAQRVGQHTQQASRGYDSCHVHINGP